MFSACMCPHYSIVIRHHYLRFDHYSDCFLWAPLTAILICEQAVCNVRQNNINSKFFLKTELRQLHHLL